jgi:hypothetical protein
VTTLRSLATTVTVLLAGAWCLAQSTSENTAAIHGVVRTADGQPIRGARVTILPRGRAPVRVAADEAGRYDGRVAIGTPYRLIVAKPGFAPATFENTTGLRNEATLDVALLPGGAVNGTVVDRFGDPMVSLSIYIVPTDPSRASEEHVTQTDERGTFRVGSLPDGAYTVQLSRAPVSFNHDALALSVPQIERYLSTMPPAPFAIERHQDVNLAMAFDAGANRVEIGAIAAESFARDLARAGGPGRPRAVTAQGSIQGWVTDTSGHPARGAVVDLRPIEGGSVRRTSTDADARFTLDDVAPGQYVIWARRDGYSGRFDDTMRRTGQVVRVKTGEQLAAPLTMSRGSVIAGVVLDQFGDPVEGAAVELQTLRFPSGRPLVVQATPSVVRMTDDRGHYSLPEVDAGSYYVVARDGLNRVFYPDRGSVAQASRIDVDERHDLLNVDLQFTSSPPSGRIYGQVVSSTDSTQPVTIVLFESARSGATVTQPRTVVTRDGAFEFTGLPAGQYAVRAMSGFEAVSFVTAEIVSGMTTRPVIFDVVQVNLTQGGAAQVTLIPRPGPIIRGHFRITGAHDGDQQPPLVLRPLAADPDGSPLDDASIRVATERPISLEAPSDNSFSVRPLTGSFRLQLANAPVGWWLESAVINGIDAAVYPVMTSGDRGTDDVEAVIATNGATLAGRVVGDRVAIDGATVVIYSVDPEQWFVGSQYVRRAHAGSNDRFIQPSLPPGEYYVVALEDVSADPDLLDWQSVSALASFATHAKRVRLSPSQQRTVDLTVP